jgi:hypothetical protein
MLHTVPLTMFIVYNNSLLDKFETLDSWCIVLSAANLVLNLAEVTYYRIYMNKGINLEQRLKMKPERRYKDLVRLGTISVFVGGIFGGIGMKYFDKQGCKVGYFERSNIECLSCASYLSDECLECSEIRKCAHDEEGYILGECRTQLMCSKSALGTYIGEIGDEEGLVV